MEGVLSFITKLESENKSIKIQNEKFKKKVSILQKNNNELESILENDGVYYKCCKCKGWFMGNGEGGLCNTPRESWLKWKCKDNVSLCPGDGGKHIDTDWSSCPDKLKEKIICVGCFQKTFPFNSNGEIINTETGEVNPNILYETDEGTFNPSYETIFDFNYYIINPELWA